MKTIPGLTNHLNSLLTGIEEYNRYFGRAKDPIAALTGERGKWLIFNPFNKSEEMIQTIVNKVSERIYQETKGEVLVSSAELETDELILYFGRRGTPTLVSWRIFGNVVNVLPWDEIIENKVVRDTLREELKEYNRLLEETKIILSSGQGLLNNGYFNLYAKSLFQKKKFRQESQEVLDSISAQIVATTTQLKQIKERDLRVMEDKSLVNLLTQLGNNFSRFPNIRSFKNYSEVKKFESTQK